MTMTKGSLSPDRRAQMADKAVAAADRLEALDPEALHYEPTADLPPALALRYEAHERDLLLRRVSEIDDRIEVLVSELRERKVSWHKISGPLHLTPEGARKKYQRA